MDITWFITESINFPCSTTQALHDRVLIVILGTARDIIPFQPTWPDWKDNHRIISELEESSVYREIFKDYMVLRKI
jgi:hypothetical protein